jgi:hypothetical protein
MDVRVSGVKRVVALGSKNLRVDKSFADPPPADQAGGKTRSHPPFLCAKRDSSTALNIDTLA